jgi:hypothetical protein
MLACHFDLDPVQFDFETAYLNAVNDKELYICPPIGHRPDNSNIVWKLKKSLYGLKQAGRNWNLQIDKFYKELGLTPLRKDPCIYYRISRTGRPILVPLYVDDGTPAYHKEDEAEWLRMKEKIFGTFKAKDLGPLQWVLNMKVTRDRDNRTITLSQQQYTKDVLARFGMTDAKPDILPHLSIPIQMKASETDEGVPLSPKDHEIYRAIIGSLLYLANLTRIDICYQVNRLSQFCHAPRVHHMTAAKRVLRYLAGTYNLALIFRGTSKTSIDIQAFSDADWATDHVSRKSISGGVVKCAGNLIHWFSKKQPLTAQSTMEAELIAMNEVTKDVLWFKDWLEEIYTSKTKIIIKCDNTAAIMSSKDDKNHQRTRHIDIRYHMVKDQIHNGILQIEYVSTQDQLADILTKPLPRQSFERFRDMFLTKE